MNDSGREFIDEIRQRGAWKAYRALVSIIENSSAPAHAKAQAASSILRAGGFFAAREDDDLEREASQMTPEELRRSIERLQLEIDGRPEKAKDVTPARIHRSAGKSVFD